jgi:tetratricopeptide (TPR) repeat protein
MDRNKPSGQSIHDRNVSTGMSRYWKFGTSCCVIAGVVAAVFLFCNQEEPLNRLVAKGRLHLAKKEYHLAKQLAERALVQNASSTDALLLAGRACTGIGQIGEALSFLERISDDTSPVSVSARCAAGDIYLFHQKKLTDAEEQFRRAISQESSNLVANNRLAYLLGLESRDWESIPYRIEVVKQKDFSSPHLYALALGDRALDNPETVVSYYNTWPESPALQLGMARVYIEIKKTRSAVPTRSGS